MVTAKFYSTAAVLCMMAIVILCTTVPKVHSEAVPEEHSETVPQVYSGVVPEVHSETVTGVYTGAVTGVYTGPVDLIILGKPLVPKTGKEILTIARETKFYPDGKLIRKFDNGQTFEYVPTQSGSEDMLTKGVTEGVLTYKFTVTGTPPPGGFVPGTYYVWVEFIGGRWQAVTVNSEGAVRCGALGVEVKQVFLLGEDEHSRAPEFTIHSRGTLGVAALQLWGEYGATWQPVGQFGCKRTSYCIPITIT